MRVVALLTACAVIAGCTTVTPEGSRIVVTGNTDQVRGCQLLGQISANEIWVGGAMGTESVIQKMQNQAANRGGTHLLTLQMSDTHYAQTSYGRGEIYRCA